MAKQGQPNENQLSFVEHYCTDAMFNGALAYKKAYPLCKIGHRQCAKNLLTKTYIVEAISKYKAQNKAEKEYNTLYIQEEHERLAELAEGKHDYATATRNKELLGKTFGAYIDRSLNINVDVGRRPPDAEAARQRSQDRIKAIEGEKVS